MAKASICLLQSFASATVFPDVLVPVLGQPKLPSDLIGTTMQVPLRRELENHLGMLGANPSFTKHMEVFQGSDAMERVSSQLQSEVGLAMSPDELFRCAQESSCLQVWTTADALTGKTVRITKILGSWSMSEIGVGNVCHVNGKRDVAYCHLPGDAYKSGLSWLAMGVPVDVPSQEPLPVGVRCHDMGPHSQDAPCHLLSGNEFMAAQIKNMNTHLQHSGESEISAAANTTVVSLGWTGDLAVRATLSSHGGMCLDLGGGSSWSGAPVQMWSCLGNDNQIWNSKMFSPLNGKPNPIEFSGDSAKENGAGTHCLDVPGGNAVEGQEVWIWECNAGDYQRWSWADTSTYPYEGQITLDVDPSLCLEQSDTEGGYPFLAACSDSDAQIWVSTQTNGALMV